MKSKEGTFQKGRSDEHFYYIECAQTLREIAQVRKQLKVMDVKGTLSVSDLRELADFIDEIELKQYICKVGGTEQTDYHINPKHVQSYTITQQEKNSNWACIDIDLTERGGCRVQIASGHGTWSAIWPNIHGKPMKQFLCGLEIQYAAECFKAAKSFCIEKTLIALKSKVQDMCIALQITQPEADAVLREIESLKNCTTARDFSRIMWSKHAIQNKIPSFDLLGGADINFEKFWNGPWQAFIAHLKNESTPLVLPSHPPVDFRKGS